MPTLLGINLFELLGTPPGTFKVLPPEITSFINLLTVVPQDAGESSGRIVHTGIVTSALSGDELDFRVAVLRIPALRGGLPFRFFVNRIPVAPGQHIEGQSGDWILQIDVPEVSILLPFEPAEFVPETAAAPAHVVPFFPESEPDSPGERPDLLLSMDAGVLEITSDGQMRVRTDFSLSPTAESDELVRFRVSPSSFFFDRDFGANVGEILFDFSATDSPPAARAAGLGDDFQGIYVEEMSLFFSRDTPYVGAFLRSASFREALIGNSFAGQAVLEFGPDLVNAPPVPTFFQVIGNDRRELAFDNDDSSVELISVAEATAPVIAVADVNTPWRERRKLARWTMPDGNDYHGPRTAPVEVHPGDVILYGYAAEEGFEPPAGRTIAVKGVLSPGAAARLQVQHGSRVFDDVTFLAAPKSWLDEATLHVTNLEDGLSFLWLINNEFPVRGGLDDQGDLLPLELGQLSAKPSQRVGVSAHGHRRFIIVDVFDTDTPIIVSAGQPIDPDGNPIEYNSFVNVYHLPMALAKGELRQLKQDLPKAPSAGGTPDLRPGRLYEAKLDLTETETIPGKPETLVVFSLFYPVDNSTTPIGLQIIDTQIDTAIPVYTGFEGTTAVAQVLRERLSAVESGRIFVVGRASRLGDTSVTSAIQRNLDLEKKRAGHALGLVNSALPSGTQAAIVGSRGESEQPNPSEAALWDSDISVPTRAAPPDSFASPGNSDAVGAAEHGLYQRADIYIRSGVFTPPPPTVTSRLASHRILIPGPPSAPSPPVASLDVDGRLRRVRLLAEWNREPFPVKAEVLSVWELSRLAIPIDVDLNTDPASATKPCEDVTDEDLLRFLLRLTYDQRSGRARWTGAVDSPGDGDGLKRFCDTGALGLLLLVGPVLAADPPVDIADGAALRWLTAAALLGAAIPLTFGDSPIIDDVDVTLNGISFEAEALDGPFADLDAVRFKLDYSVAFHVDAGLVKTQPGQAPAADQRGKMRVRYRGVGLEVHNISSFDSPGDILSNVDMFFDPAKGGDVQIEDNGAFQMHGALGKLLNVVGARIGHGSLFMELDLAFALDLGVVEVSQATLRILFGESGPSVELRGLGVGVSIENVIEGTGALTIGDGGAIHSELDLQVIPAGVHASGRLDLVTQDDFIAVALGLDTEFATGLPLAATGLGIYGFFGRFAANMRRSVNISAPDRVAEELRWLRTLLRNEPNSWLVQQQNWGFGVGTVVGTLADGARSFHAKGGLVLEIPGPAVVFGVDATFMRKRRKTKTDDVEGTITGLALIDPFVVLIGIEVLIEVGNFLTIHVPVGAFFPRKPLPGDSEVLPAFLRIGSDGIDPGGGRPVRSGTPARALIRAGSLGNVAQVFAFLMIEERDLLLLYGRTGLDFHGFSIGFGVGVELRWGNSAVSLRASALLLVGLSTAPFVIAGALEIEGEIKLLVYSIAASADLDFRHDSTGTVFDGEFCGKVEFMFFSIKGCVRLRLGDGNPLAVPAPPPLITGLSLADRRAKVIRSVDVDPESTAPIAAAAVVEAVWPDTVPVLHFAHEPKTDLGATSPFSGQLSGLEHSDRVYAGDFCYQFSLKDLLLEKRAGASFVPVAGPLEAAWWFPAWRPAFLAGDAQLPSGEESRELGLLTWHPAPWGRSLIAGLQQDALDGIGAGIDNVCDPKLPPPIDCALFSASTPGPEPDEWQVRSLAGQFNAIVTDQSLNKEPPSKAISTLLAHQYHYQAPHIVAWEASADHRGHEVDAGLRLSRAFRFQTRSNTLRTAVSFDTRIALSGDQRQPELLLAMHIVDLEEPLEPDRNFETFKTAEGFPFVVVQTDNTEEEVPGKLISTVQTPFGDLLLILYRHDTADQRARSWRIKPFAGEVQLVAECGQDADAFDAVEENNDDRTNWQDAVRERSETGDPVPSVTVLDAGSEYRITALWAWKGWHKKKPIDVRDDEVSQSFTFRTAPALTDFDQRRTALEQDQFDPRALSSYVIKQPRLEAPPTFLDDAIRVGFSVDHVAPLLDRYDRSLTLEVLRTDVPAAPVAAGGGALNVPFVLEMKRVISDPVDLLLALRIAQAPCLDGATPPLGGVEAVLHPDLAPNARYELLVRAANDLDSSEPKDQALIIRAPFTSSRYRSPEDLFEALGFGPASAPGSDFPSDLMLPAGPVPSVPETILADDTALAAALADLGFDPLEPPAAPRTTLFWKKRNNGRWQVTGMLLDVPEPIERPGRLHLQFAQLRGRRFDAVRSSAAGTRVLLMPAAAPTMPKDAESNLDLIYREGESGPDLVVSRVVVSFPVTMLWEV